MNQCNKTESLKEEQACSLLTQTWCVYLLCCADSTLYCGITNHLSRRLKQHNGQLVGGAKYTQARQPCELVYCERVESKGAALKREYVIKQLTRTQKWALIKGVH